jgi:hypothetical protein
VDREGVEREAELLGEGKIERLRRTDRGTGRDIGRRDKGLECELLRELRNCEERELLLGDRGDRREREDNEIFGE